jgi:hypothetical protein
MHGWHVPIQGLSFRSRETGQCPQDNKDNVIGWVERTVQTQPRCLHEAQLTFDFTTLENFRAS